MISPRDLALWGLAGLQIEDEPGIVPPAPNFRGDHNVKFTRHNENGEIVGAGFMHRDHIVAEQEAGGRIQIEDDDHPGLPPPPLPSDVERLTDLVTVIGRELTRSDHYFLTDRVDVDDAKRAVWTAYRKALRDARDLSELTAVIAALPKADPKGVDPFAFFRT